MKKKMMILLTAIALNCSDSVAQKYIFNYSLNNPDRQFDLPLILNEVSGLTDIDSAHVACVQDELGIIFIYNFRTGKVVNQHKFDLTGDFEGLSYTGKSIFVLRSDGRLTEWSGFKPGSGGERITHYKLPLQTSNNEGLCFDKKRNRLLIAAKSKPFDHDVKSERFIYEFDLNKGILNRQPVYSLNTDKLAVKAREFRLNPHSIAPNGKMRPFNFRPASLAIHPHSDMIYIISAADRLLLVMNPAGEVVHMEALSPALYAKAEGITFLNDGTMIITNEAAGNSPTLLLFESKNLKRRTALQDPSLFQIHR